MIYINPVVAVGALIVLVFVAMLVMAWRDGAKNRRQQKAIDARLNTWVRPPTEAERDYSQWLASQDLSQWPYEPRPGYDERKESA